jgi:hypothetical protein
MMTGPVPRGEVRRRFGTHAEGDLKDYLGHRDIRSTRRYVRAAKQRYGSIQSLGLTGPNAEDDTKSETGTEGDR